MAAMSFGDVHKFAVATQLALRLQKVGRLGLLEDSDFHRLRTLQQGGWNIYVNSLGEARAISPDGTTIQIDRENTYLKVKGPNKELA